jgi:hypothetical protein
VLVKSWLLALPHLLIIGLVTANLSFWAMRQESAASQDAGGISLIGLLILVAGVLLLLTYAALMRDEYPPFQLGRGPDDPGGSPQPEPEVVPEPVISEVSTSAGAAVLPGRASPLA